MSEQQAPDRKWAWLAVGLALAVLIAVLVVWGRPIYEFIADQDKIRAWVADFGPWGPAVIVLLEMTQAVLGPVPGTTIEAAAGYLFGPWWGALYAITGIALGSFISFTLARHLGRPVLRRLADADQVERLDAWAERGGSLFFFLLWLFPLLPDDVVCLAAGLTPMSPRRFLLLMVVGRTPGVFAAVWIGANAAQLGPVWWIVALVGLGGAAFVFWRWGEEIQAALIRLLQRIAEGWDHERK